MRECVCVPVTYPEILATTQTQILLHTLRLGPEVTKVDLLFLVVLLLPRQRLVEGRGVCAVQFGARALLLEELVVLQWSKYVLITGMLILLLFSRYLILA